MKKVTRILPLLAISFTTILIMSCGSSGTESPSSSESEVSSLPLEEINLPEGFTISIYADNLKNARSMALSPDGTLFVGTQKEGNIYAVRDTDGDFKVDETYVIDSGLRSPNGVAIKDGDLYIADVENLWIYRNVESDLQNPVSRELIYDDYPKDFHHGWKYIAFGPDGKLYVPVGAPCNICESQNELYASITRMDPDGSNREIYAHGVRNTVGFTWHPDTGEMWFTDNGRDLMGDEVPPCELNKVTEAGQHYGYPYCHGGSIKDPEFGNKYPCDDFVKPEQQLGPHVAPLGIKFYDGNQFPEDYNGHAFIAEHGSWNRSKKIGYRISMVRIEKNEAVSYETFADGWLDDEAQEVWGRPVDVLIMPDGSMLVSDDMANVIYRIAYSG